MFFYKVNVNDSITNAADGDTKLRMRQSAHGIASATAEFNQGRQDVCYCFVFSSESDCTSCGIISNTYDVAEITRDFLSAIGISDDNPQTEEITFSSMQNLLRTAERYRYIDIDDRDNMLERYGLDELDSRYARDIKYTDHLITLSSDRAALYGEAGRLLSEDTLSPELDRIYSVQAQDGIVGHPVHYFIETDSRDIEKAYSQVLLQALYENRRVKSRRYCCVEFSPRMDFSYDFYDALYKSCTDGSVIVRLPADEDQEQDTYADTWREIIPAVCKTMRKYRNRILTVFSLPRVCENTKSMLREQLGDIGIVEIREDLTDYKRSVEYLGMLCQEHNIQPDNQLFAKLEEDKRYFPDELQSTFAEWYDVKIRTSVFPQYSGISVCRREAIKEDVRGTAYDELRALTGLNEAKDIICKALSFYKMQRIYADRKIKQDRPAMHMVFTGNPGTAKTTVARLFSRIMKENGLLSKGHLVEVGRSDLVGKYLGWTAQIVRDKFVKAMGGVLFIDEAYSLAEERNGLYGDEAINTIVQEMENRRGDLVVIFAGYPDKMEDFLHKNPGLRSRIAFHVHFSDYSADELCDIARIISKSKGITLADSAIEKLASLFEQAHHTPDFGNGRYVRNVIELSRMNQAERILSLDPDYVSDDMLVTLEAEDIVMPAQDAQSVKRKIGFMS